jgi:hypothetical protein
MPSSTNGERQYRLAFSGVIRRALHRLQIQASLEARGNDFLRALRTIVDRLTHNPNEFGEPLYRLSALRLRVHAVVVDPLAVTFAVHEDRPVVFIKTVDLLPKK